MPSFIEILQAEISQSGKRADVRSSLPSFSSTILGLKNKWFHEQAYQMLTTEKRSLILWPRGFGKSSICSTIYPSWALGRDPNLRIIVASNTYALSKMYLRQIEQILNMPAYQDAFGNLVPDARSSTWTDLEKIVLRTKIMPDASLLAIGVGGATINRRCFDDQTEVLTGAGWKLFKDLSGSEDVATLSSSGHLEYQHPSDYISYPFKGDLLVLDAYNINFAVTPGHNVLAAARAGARLMRANHQLFGAFNLYPIESVFGKRTFRFKRDCVWQGSNNETISIPGKVREWAGANGSHRKKCYPPMNLPTKEFMAFLGFWVAEGCTFSAGRTWGIRITQSANSRHNDDFSQILEALGLPSTPKVRAGGKILDWYFGKPQLACFLDEHFGVSKYTKRVPAFVKGLSAELLEIFLQWFIKGDGCITKAGTEILVTTSRQLADDLSEIILKTGRASNLSVRPAYRGKILGRESNFREAYRITTTKRFLRPAIRRAKDSWKTLSYDGTVYCVSVPNRTIYVRRKGRTMWMGNCDLAVLDDCVTPKNSSSLVLREALRTWFWQALYPVLEPITGQLIVSGTRYSTEDLYSELLRKWEDRDADSPMDLPPTNMPLDEAQDILAEQAAQPDEDGEENEDGS
jgi:hypothetical protein